MLGEVDKYSWQDIGSSFGLSDVLAALLYGQLEQRDVILAKRRAVSETYSSMLVADRRGVRRAAARRAGRSRAGVPHVLRAPARPATRDAVLESMRAAEACSPTFHYVPLHSAPGGERFAARRTECPVTDDISGRLLRLPFHNNLAMDDIDAGGEFVVQRGREDWG